MLRVFCDRCKADQGAISPQMYDAAGMTTLVGNFWNMCTMAPDGRALTVIWQLCPPCWATVQSAIRVALDMPK